ncbi:MAG: hypothetical protein J6N72_03640, partial [Psychrobacter sp.]|nr:hypothetical protein [Psychrobacter sp.]
MIHSFQIIFHFLLIILILSLLAILTLIFPASKKPTKKEILVWGFVQKIIVSIMKLFVFANIGFIFYWLVEPFLPGTSSLRLGDIIISLVQIAT